MKMYLKKYWYEIIFALILVGSFACIVTVKYGYIYSTNDDVMIKNILCGNFSGVTESHVINVMYLSGFVGKFLYDIFPNVSWYDLFMILFHYLAWFMIVMRLGQLVEGKKNKTIVMLGLFVLLAVVDFKYLLLHQYTILTSQLAGVSYLWMLTSIGKEGKEYWIDRGIALLIFFVAMNLRREAFLLSLPIGGLVFLYEIWKTKSYENCKQHIKKILGYVVVCCTLIVVVYGIESVAYNSEEWSAFQDSHSARIQIYDYTGVPSYEAYKEDYSSLAVDYGDWVAIDVYNCEFAKTFDVMQMEAIALLSKEAWNEANSLLYLLKQSILSYCILVFENDIQPIGLLLGILYSITFIVISKKNDKKGLAMCGALLLFNVVVSVYLIARARFLERVSYGLYFSQMIFLLAYISQYIKDISVWAKNNRIWMRIATLIFFGMMSVAFLYSWQSTQKERVQMVCDAEDWKYINEYFADAPENRYCIDTKSFVFSTEKMFSEKIESDNMIRLGGWILNSPLQRTRLEKQGIFNLVEQMAEEDNYYIVQDSSKDMNWIDAIWNKSEYDVEAVIVDCIVTPSGRTFDVIQLQ